ncbi:sensor histidine kinase [Paraburkholderia caribensis]|uniref:sensor histidine kinase n=1 Tax=Paraburkholderia caribensis TaxID=75105 RepID=UPI00078DF1C3|nr:HAMP domain-containing sensor histidine kinase [Paraburkholderia caribensis]AMV48489.1 ATPase [Paraburkholderia caribensis]
MLCVHPGKQVTSDVAARYDARDALTPSRAKATGAHCAAEPGEIAVRKRRSFKEGSAPSILLGEQENVAESIAELDCGAEDFVTKTLNAIEVQRKTWRVLYRVRSLNCRNPGLRRSLGCDGSELDSADSVVGKLVRDAQSARIEQRYSGGSKTGCEMLNHWIRSLSVRLWLTTVVALATSLTLLAALVVYVLDHYPEQTLGRREQMENARNVVDGIKFNEADIPTSVKLPAREAWLFQTAPTELKYRVLNAQGDVLLASTEADKHGPWLTNPSAVAGAVGHVVINGKRFSVATLRILRGQSVFYVQTAMSLPFIDALVSLKVKPIPNIVRVTFFVAIVIFGVALPFTIHRVLKPLRDASDAAMHITPRNLKTRLSAIGVPSEIKPLINAFNDALGRLEDGYMVQQQFLAAAAHELQTPLTLIRGQIELQPEIKDKDLLFRQIDLMSRQVRQLLHLAEVSEEQNFTFGDVNSTEVMQDVVAYLARKADSKQVTMHIKEHTTSSMIWADKSAMFILLKNIVENAINASPENGVVLLTIDKGSIEVCDEGNGIPQAHLPHLFERFWRAPGAKYEGAGLGLAICKEIALAHDWTLTVSSVAIGTRFIVWL